MFINLVASRLLLNILGVEDFGIYNLVGGVVGLFSMLSATLQSASQRFITYALGKGETEELKQVFTTSVTLHVLIGFVIVFALEIVGIWLIDSKLNIPTERLDIAKYVYQFSILSFFINFISIPFSADIIAHEKMSAYAYITIFESFLKLGAILLLLRLGADKLLSYSCFHCISVLIVSLLYICYVHRTFKEAAKLHLYVHKTIFRDMFSFTGWNFIGSSALVLRNQGIDIILNIFFGVITNAARGIATQAQTALQLFVNNFTTSINPQLTAAIAQKDYPRAERLIFHGSRMLFFMITIVAVPIMVLTHEILNIWLGSVPEYSVAFVRLTIFFLLFDTLSNLLKKGLLADGDIRNFQLSAGVLKLMALPITYLLLRCGGSVIVGYIVCITIDVCSLVVELYFAHTKLSLNVEKFIKSAFFPCCLTFLMTYVVSHVFYTYISSRILLVAPVSIMFCIAVAYLMMNSPERRILLSIIRTWIR